MKAFRQTLILTCLMGMIGVFAACTGPQPNAPTSGPTPGPPTAVPPASTVRSIQPTATDTIGPPTYTPSPAFTLATSAQEIIGTWRERSLYIRFDEDGTFRQAHALDTLDSRPYAISSYHFEGTTLVTTALSVSGVPSCGDVVGSYEIRLLENGNILITTIQDACSPRAGDTAGEKEPVVIPTP